MSTTSSAIGSAPTSSSLRSSAVADSSCVRSPASVAGNSRGSIRDRKCRPEPPAITTVPPDDSIRSRAFLPAAWNSATVYSSEGSAMSTRWYANRRRVSGSGFAVPISIPRKTCIESTDRISAPTRAAIASATSDFPAAVGPSTAMMLRPMPPRDSAERRV